MKIVKLLIGPVFWIGITYAAIRYGPEIINNAKSGQPLINRAENKNADKVLGEENNENIRQTPKQIILPPPPKSVQEIPDYAKAVAGEVADKALQTGTEAVQQTAGKVSENVCQQIITELQKQCGSEISVPSPSPEPTKSE